jgi:Gram-negative bacterial TonB protein C-terminal
MANIWSLTRSETDHRPPSILQGASGGIKANSAEFLELRTEAGAVYLRPSRWQRLRLRWVFRHFRVLSPQVLSRRDRSLIGKLSRSAQITPVIPLPESTVFGVVEEPHSAYSVAVRRSVATRLEDLPGFEERIELPDISGRRELRGSRAMARGSVAGLVALSAVCAALILARVFGVLPGNASPAHPQTMTSGQASDSAKAQVVEPPASHSVQASPAAPSSVSLEKKQAAAPVPAEAALVPAPPPPLPRKSSILSNETGQPAIASGAAAPRLPTPVTAATPEPLIVSPPPLAPPAQNQPLEGIAASSLDTATASGTRARLHVSELPQSNVIYPVASNPNLVGNVDLRAVIGADGTVKGVTVLSGNPKLAEAGNQAVRHWRYSPYEVLGHPVEVETNIKISFLGEDVVSISSPSTAAAEK